MTISIKDIARRAGVSHSTVSRALTGSSLVNAETKAHIRQLAQEMGYAPSAVARAMSTRRTQTIGVVVTSIADPFVAQVVRGIEETALDCGYSVLLCNSNDDPEREIATVRALREKWVDAVIVAASRVGSFYAELTEIRVPVVLINNQQPGAYSFSVRNDDLIGGRLVGTYLLGLGHQHIAYISGRQSATSSQLRLEGCRQVLNEAGVTIPPKWIVAGDGKPAGGEQSVDRLLESPPYPGAIFCYNDQTAMGALHALKAKRVRVPQEISLIGYDDIAAARYLDPPLTTIAQTKYALGQQAMEMTRALLAGETVQDVLLQPDLIVRQSCAPA